MGAELVEEVDSRFADGLWLVEETEAQRLQAVEMRREPREELHVIVGQP